MDALPTLWIVFVAFVAAGLVKGITGVGLPLMVMAALTLFTDPRTAFSLVFVPIFLSNIFQLYRIGNGGAAVKRYAPFIACMMLSMPLFFWLSADATEPFLLAGLGMVLIVFVIFNLTSYVPRIPDQHERSAQVGLGLAAGVLGGVTSVWLPAIAILLTARNVPKDEFIRATALLLLLGSLPLFFGYIAQGFLTGPLGLLSIAMVVPTTLGQLAGEKLRTRLSERAFRKATLLLFLLVGLNLLRRGLFA